MVSGGLIPIIYARQSQPAHAHTSALELRPRTRSAEIGGTLLARRLLIKLLTVLIFVGLNAKSKQCKSCCSNIKA